MTPNENLSRADYLDREQAAETTVSVTPAGRALGVPCFGEPPSLQGAAPWFVLQVQVNRAFRIREWLREAGIGEWLPTYTETIRWSDRQKTFERQVFPGYILVRLATVNQSVRVLRFPGVISLLPTALSPIAVDDQEIRDLRKALASALPVQPCAYVAGQRVTIRRGALAGVTGAVVRVKGETRVVVGIEMLGRAVSVTIEAADLEKAA